MEKINNFNIKLMPSELIYSASSDKTLLESAFESGLVLEHSCKNGACRVCEAICISPESSDEKTILSCQFKPSSDLVIYAEYFPELVDIELITSPAKVNKVVFSTADIMVLIFRLPPKKIFKYLPGQYVDLKYQGITRSYSIASIPNKENFLELHIKRVESGVMSEKIFSPISINQLVQLEGPKGTFFFRNIMTGPVICIATGTGFAPIKSMISQLIEMNQLERPIYIYWGNRCSNLFYDRNIVEKWTSENPSITGVFCLSRSELDWDGRIGYVQDCVLQDSIDLRDAEVYACGSVDMINSAKDIMVKAGLDGKNFYSDAFVAS
jgi:CDP-4-dehydro-6-deoxyglucose reductase